MSRKGTQLVAIAGALVLSLTACGSGGTNQADAEETAADSTIEAAVALLPDDIKSGGTVTVVGAAYPPNTIVAPDNKSVSGLLPDLGDAIGERLGVEMDWKIANFDGIIPGLESGRYDMAIADLSDNPERQKRIDFVNFLTAGDVAIVLPDSPLKDITELTEMCGMTVSAQTGTATVPAAEAASAECEANGEEPFDLQLFPDNNANLLALTSGRVDAMLNGINFAAYLVQQQPDEFVVTQARFNNALSGMAFAKDSEGLRDAVQLALQDMIDDGSYQELLDEYDVGDRGIEEATINGGT